MVPRLEGVSTQALDRVRSRRASRSRARTRPVEVRAARCRSDDEATWSRTGASSCCPTPSAGDLFFDIEGDPFALDDGVEYLFGVLEPARTDPTGQPMFHEIWSRDADGDVTRGAEKAAFEELVDLFIDRLDADPSMHVYHYAPYEKTALEKLAQRHATREEEVDRLLRGRVLVDLFRVVRQGIRASVESYSIKSLEPLYGLVREEDLKTPARASSRSSSGWRSARPSGAVGEASCARSRTTTGTTCVATGSCATGWRHAGWTSGASSAPKFPARRPATAPHPRTRPPT